MGGSVEMVSVGVDETWAEMVGNMVFEAKSRRCVLSEVIPLLRRSVDRHQGAD